MKAAMDVNRPQIEHESEIHRQHIRLRIPIGVEIDGVRYVTDDWSMGGFGVNSDIDSRQPGERFPARLLFPFEDFEIVLRVDCQMVYVTEERDRFGCRFLGLTQGQLDLFRYLVDAYLSGEIVSAGDLLAIAARETDAQERSRLLADAFLEEERSLARRVRRWAGHLLLLGSALGLAVLVYLGVQERYFVVKTDRAVIWTPLLPLDAPVAGKVEAAPRKVIYEAGDPVARIRGLAGETVVLESPCECVVLEWAVLPGAYARAGEPVLVLAAADRPLVVRAQLPLAQAMRLRKGQRAEIYLPGESRPRLAQIEDIDFKPKLTGLITNPSGASVASDRAQVLLRPDRPFDFERLGTLVRVRFL